MCDIVTRFFLFYGIYFKFLYYFCALFSFQGLRDCCRSIRIGKILVESDNDTHEAHVVYAKFPEDIARRQVLLMYPIMSTGNTVKQVRVIHIWLLYIFK